MSGRTRKGQGIAVALVVLSCLAFFSSAAGAAKPDLIVSTVSSRAATNAGGTLPTAVTVRNRGAGRSGASLTGLALSRDRTPGRDIALIGKIKSGTLAPRRSTKASSSLGIPKSVSGGSYFVIACADVDRSVREASEKNNCRSSKSAIRITPAGPGKLAFVPSGWNFGPLDIEAAASLSKVLKLKNTGGAALPAISVVDLEGFPGFFSDSDGCLGEVLGPGETCPVRVSYATSEVGSHSATLTAGAGPKKSASASLSGSGIDVVEPAVITVDPGSHDFGSVISGQSSAAFEFRVFHGGEADSGPLNLQITGPDSSQFVISDPFCQDFVLSERVLCGVEVKFRPTSPGLKSATLQVSATPGGTRTATLTGTGLAAASLSISPNPKDFGSVTAGQPSLTTVFTVTNNGAGTAGSSGGVSTVYPEITGSDASSFKLDFSSTTCGQTLAPGASCDVGVWFQPPAGSTGVKTATLTVSATPGGAASTNLSGTSLSG